jgi:hypothetical protein
VAYLFDTYGQRDLPLRWRAGRLQTVGSMLASAPRLNKGMRARPGQVPDLPLELYSFESSPYARPVRELLCAMEMPYILRNCGRTRLDEWLLPPLRERLNVTPQSTIENRRVLQEREGRVAIPYLYDPNSDRGMFESADILDYLQQIYAA